MSQSLSLILSKHRRLSTIKLIIRPITLYLLMLIIRRHTPCITRHTQCISIIHILMLHLPRHRLVLRSNRSRSTLVTF